MADKVFTTSTTPANPPVNLANVVGMRKVGYGATATIVFILNYNNNVTWAYQFEVLRDQEYERLIDLDACCGLGGGGLSELEELVETFENLISGTDLTITGWTAGDIILVHRNGLYKRLTHDYSFAAGVISFLIPFGSSTGGLGDGESVTIVTLRQT